MSWLSTLVVVVIFGHLSIGLAFALGAWLAKWDLSSYLLGDEKPSLLDGISVMIIFWPKVAYDAWKECKNLK